MFSTRVRLGLFVTFLNVYFWCHSLECHSDQKSFFHFEELVLSVLKIIVRDSEISGGSISSYDDTITSSSSRDRLDNVTRPVTQKTKF